MGMSYHRGLAWFLQTKRRPSPPHKPFIPTAAMIISIDTLKLPAAKWWNDPAANYLDSTISLL
jgi:hypothetical protein